MIQSLREMRNAKHLSLADVASKAKIWPSDLSEYERGVRPMPDGLRQRILTVLAELPSKDRVRRGFASLDTEQRQRIAQMGGKRAHELGHAHRFSSEEAHKAGVLGGKSVSQNVEHMRQIGQRGGRKSKRRRRSPGVGQ